MKHDSRDEKDNGLTGDLRQLADLHALDRLMGAFIRATGLPSGCGIFDLHGERLVPVDLTRFPRICRVVWTSSRGQERCSALIRQIIEGYAATGSSQASHHTCHLGLTVCAAPILEGSAPIGVVLAGQVWEKPPSARRRAGLIRGGDWFDIDRPEMERALDDIRVVPPEEMRGAAGLLQAIVSHVVSAGLSCRRSEREAELEKMLYETELGMLQSQINPHFLFNALNTVMWLASLEKAKETVKIVCALADLLRYNLRQLGQLVPLQQELEQIKGYLLIQKARFADRLHFVVDVEPSAAMVPVPVLILQPLVENAIIHGLEAKAGSGTLVVTARRKGSGVVIEVRDDGIGMSREAYQSLAERVRKAGSQVGAPGLGITNVVRSLRHHFGDRAAMEIVSNAGQGTTVRLTIPTGEAGTETQPTLGAGAAKGRGV
ncbi:MAG: histidine kinase [Chloroflexi bacterium]|nr:histidine kinase [Chloroflexota bacterium]